MQVSYQCHHLGYEYNVKISTKWEAHIYDYSLRNSLVSFIINDRHIITNDIHTVPKSIPYGLGNDRELINSVFTKSRIYMYISTCSGVTITKVNSSQDMSLRDKNITNLAGERERKSDHQYFYVLFRILKSTKTSSKNLGSV